MSRASVMTEARNAKGEWTAGAGAVKRALAQAEFNGERSPEMDRVGAIGHPEAMDSINTQTYAQGVAKATYDHLDEMLQADSHSVSKADQQAVSLWNEYQSPSEFGVINGILRTGKSAQGVSAKEMRAHVDRMYDLLGYTLPKPMTVYRAIHAGGGSGIDWKKKLQPGSIFQDNGFESSTAEPGYALGWLDLPNHPDGKTLEGSGGRKEQPNDIVMEIHLPAGTRIVGGDPQFIETMIRPGTKFRIVSQEQRVGKNGRNPLLNGMRQAVQKPFTYTHVVAEVMP